MTDHASSSLSSSPSNIRELSAVFLALLSAATWLVGPAVGAGGDADALLSFKASLSNATTALSSWKPSVPPCVVDGHRSTWKGVLCRNGVVFALRLENMSLSGALDLNALAPVSSLRSLSFMYNGFDGPMPRGISALVGLRTLYLAFNRFSGGISEDVFAGMNDLRKIHLEGNQFSGGIPASLARLPDLVELDLEGNMLSGVIPEFQQTGLVMVNVANNRLVGRIPYSLSNMNYTFFTGNAHLCGRPLSPCRWTHRRPPQFTVVLLAAAMLAVVVLLTVVATVCCINRAQGQVLSKQLNSTNKQDSSIYKKLANEAVHREVAKSPPSIDKPGDQRQLHFVRNDREKFTLQDMLRASAEVLGSGGFGSSYKAVLAIGQAMVVKRFRYMNNVGKEGFYDHMKKIGRLSHPNLLPLIAFYYRRDEKLLVSNFVSNGSLANLLHANRTPDQVVLDWQIRLRIIRGVARGLDYLYRVFPDLNLPHGHLKSSNVLLDNNFEPLLTDYALVPVVNKEQSQQFMVAYKAPEFTQQDRTSRKSDVWSLGILILEILTGKFPANYLRQGKEAIEELAAWVESIARAEWTAEVFDKDMRAGREHEGQMLKMLKIGVRCCEWDMERRIELREAVERIEELEADTGGDYDTVRSSYVTASEGDRRSSRAMTEEFLLM